MKTGYTEKQAERLMLRIDANAEKAISEVDAMFAHVPDLGMSGASIESEIRMRAAYLKDVVSRRRRSR